jgi:predicted RNase H-like nuclease
MQTFTGIDGFRRGWVAVWIDEHGHQGFDYSPTVDRLLSCPHHRAMIDIPIGLPERGYRACDEKARELLGSHVFLGARRDLWTFKNATQANAYYWSSGQKGISVQLWSIRCKIKEIDELMTSERQQKLRETHPELVFWKLKGRARLSSKKTELGRRERIELLRANGFTKIETWLDQRYRTGIGRDDLIDACACAIVAKDGREWLPKKKVDLDLKGLRMEMWY